MEIAKHALCLPNIDFNLLSGFAPFRLAMAEDEDSWGRGVFVWHLFESYVRR